MHQSWMLRIHWKYVFDQLSGTKRMRPSSTARIAGSASGAIRTYHWSVSQGSSTAPAAVAARHLQRVRLDLLEQSGRLEVGDDALARLEAVEAAIGGRRRVVQRRVGGEDVDQRQAVALADLEVVEVVRGRDLHAAAAECGVDVLVGDDRDRAIGQRQADRAADEVTVALVLGMHGDRGIAEHGLGARRRDHDVAAAIRERIAQVPELPCSGSASTSRSESAVCSTGSQLTSRFPR